MDASTRSKVIGTNIMLRLWRDFANSVPVQKWHKVITDQCPIAIKTPHKRTHTLTISRSGSVLAVQVVIL